MKGSIRWRLLVFALVTMASVLAASGTAVVLMFERSLLKRVEQELDIRWMELAKAFTVDEAGHAALNHELADPRYLAPLSGAYWQVTDKTGILLRSRSLWDEELLTRAVDAALKERGAFEIDGPNKAELYVVERKVHLSVGGENRDFSLIVAIDHAEIVEARSAFAWDVALLLALMAVVLTLGFWVQLNYGLAPLAALGRSLAAMREGRAKRLEAPFPAEVAPLADDLNQLLDRQDQLVEKARNRAGTLAHGLKTPLTILAGEIEKLEQAGEHERAARLGEQCAAIRTHVERELARARTYGALPARGRLSEVGPMVDKLVDLMRRVDPDRAIEWRVSLPAGLRSAIEASDLAEILGNLLDNARKWARSRVTVECREAHGHVRIAVIDDGPGLPDDRWADMLERGAHVGRKGEHSSGLGLAIVRDTLAEYGITLLIDRTAAGGCAAQFDLSPSWSAPEAAKARAAPTPVRQTARTGAFEVAARKTAFD